MGYTTIYMYQAQSAGRYFLSLGPGFLCLVLSLSTVDKKGYSLYLMGSS